MFLYRIAISLVAPFLVLRLALRDGRAALRERLALTPDTHDGQRRGPVLWLHAASNGELTAARGLIDALLALDPRLRLIITCNSITGRDLAMGWALARTDIRLAPLDLRPVLRRSIARWQPDALILIENELWPNRMVLMQRLSRPVIVVSARMSARSAANWARLPGLSRRVMESIAYLSAQDSASERHLLALGLPETALGPVLNLKTDTAAGAADARVLAQLRPGFERARTVLAASTHDGEETLVLRGFAAALAKRPGLKLILAPRHPQRRDEILRLIDRNGLRAAIRSQGQVPDAQTQVFLADTLGEMPLWYELAGVVFVGGSLVPRGGHTPFEPAAHGCALLHGAHVENFADSFAALDAAGAAITVAGADDITAALLLLDHDKIADMVARAAPVMTALRDGPGLRPLLDRLRLLTGIAQG